MHETSYIAEQDAHVRARRTRAALADRASAIARLEQATTPAEAASAQQALAELDAAIERLKPVQRERVETLRLRHPDRDGFVQAMVDRLGYVWPETAICNDCLLDEALARQAAEQMRHVVGGWADATVPCVICGATEPIKLSSREIRLLRSERESRREFVLEHYGTPEAMRDQRRVNEIDDILERAGAV